MLWEKDQRERPLLGGCPFLRGSFYQRFHCNHSHRRDSTLSMASVSYQEVAIITTIPLKLVSDK